MRLSERPSFITICDVQIGLNFKCYILYEIISRAHTRKLICIIEYFIIVNDFNNEKSDHYKIISDLFKKLVKQIKSGRLRV